MAGIFTLESSLNCIFYYPKNSSKDINFLWCVGKKTVYFDRLTSTVSAHRTAMLLQTEASTYVLGLVPKALVMLFCGLVVHYIVFFFLSFSS